MNTKLIIRLIFQTMIFYLEDLERFAAAYVAHIPASSAVASYAFPRMH